MRPVGARMLVDRRDRRLARELKRHARGPIRVLNLPALLARHTIAQVDARSDDSRATFGMPREPR